MAMNDEMFEAILKRFDRMESEIKAMRSNMNQRFAELFAKFDVQFVKKEKVIETNIEVNRIELSLENNELKFYSGTPKQQIMNARKQRTVWLFLNN